MLDDRRIFRHPHVQVLIWTASVWEVVQVSKVEENTATFRAVIGNVLRRREVLEKTIPLWRNLEDILHYVKKVIIKGKKERGKSPIFVEWTTGPSWRRSRPTSKFVKRHVINVAPRLNVGKPSSSPTPCRGPYRSSECGLPHRSEPYLKYSGRHIPTNISRKGFYQELPR